MRGRPAQKKNNTSRLGILICFGSGLLGALILLVVQFHLYGILSSNDSNTASERGDLIEVINFFNFPVSIFFDDHESGTFLTTLRSGESMQMEAYEGQVIYATHLNDWKSLESVEIKSASNGEQMYSFGHDLTPNTIPHGKKKLLPTSKQHPPSLAKLALKTLSNVTNTLNYNIFPKISDMISNHFNEGNIGDIGVIAGGANIDHSHPNLITHNAYVSTHLNESMVLMHTASFSIAAQFRSIFPRPVKMWFYTGGAAGHDGSLQGILKMGQETTLNGYLGHIFYFTAEEDGKDVEIARFPLQRTQVLYVVRPVKPEDWALVPPQLIDIDKKQSLFADEYFNRTGILWRHFFGKDGPRPPPVLHMWPATNLQQVHPIVSDQNYWVCAGTASKCQERGSLHLQLEVVSTAPKVFIIHDFLSDFEAEAIIAIAKPRIHKSTIGNGEEAGGAHESDTRTSSNAWVSRETSPITQTLYKRAAHVLNVDEALLHSHKNAEEMQVVHYLVSQHYDAHHDWGVSGYAESRYITLLIYLSDIESENGGGETSFPKGNNGEGFKVKPVKGQAVLFYNLLEDGNGDDLSLHASLPVQEGEKWLANFWVWDPKRE